MCHNESCAYDHVLYIYNIYYICATMRGMLMIMYCIYIIYILYMCHNERCAYEHRVCLTITYHPDNPTLKCIRFNAHTSDI